MPTVSDFLNRIIEAIIGPIMQVIAVLALLYFVWGIASFMWSLGGGDREKGKKHLIWGSIGMVIVLSVWGIVAALCNYTGANCFGDRPSEIYGPNRPISAPSGGR